MNHFIRREGELCCEDVPLGRIAAEVGTPTYVYSTATLTRHYRVFGEAFGDTPHLVCYSVKALSTLAVLRLLARLGSGFDIVSGGELHRVLLAGGDPRKVVFSGVGKTEAEMARALEVGIKCFNVESLAELDHLAAIAARAGRRAPVSLRVNPDVDPKTHPYIATGLRHSKFGIPAERALEAYRRARSFPSLEVVGIDCHIGSQLADVAPMIDACRRLLDLVDALTAEGMVLQHLDIGGGLGVTYDQETPPSPASYAAALRAEIAGRDLELVLEPGRVITANAGVLLTRVLLTKEGSAKRFVVVDAAMNDALRPALYGAWHGVEPVSMPREARQVVDVVGPVCESGDFLARDRDLPELQAGDLVVLRTAGAYGFVMSSNYNSRPRSAEVLVGGQGYEIIRDRETLDDLTRGERMPPGLG
jgi:diaminopimelate decarboxylase